MDSDSTVGRWGLLGLSTSQAMDTRLSTATDEHSAVVRAAALSLVYPDLRGLDGIAMRYKVKERQDFRPQFQSVVDANTNYEDALSYAGMSLDGSSPDAMVSLHVILLAREYVADGVCRVLLNDGSTAWWAFCSRDATSAIVTSAQNSIWPPNTAQGQQVVVNMVHVKYETQWTEEYRIPVVLSFKFVPRSREKAWVGSPQMAIHSMSWVTYAGGDLNLIMQSPGCKTITTFAIVSKVDIYNVCEQFVVYLFDGEKITAVLCSQKRLMPWLRTNVETSEESNTSAIAIVVASDSRLSAKVFAGKMSVVCVSLETTAETPGNQDSYDWNYHCMCKDVKRFNHQDTIFKITSIETMDTFNDELSKPPRYRAGLLKRELGAFAEHKYVPPRVTKVDHRDFLLRVVSRLHTEGVRDKSSKVDFRSIGDKDPWLLDLDDYAYQPISDKFTIPVLFKDSIIFDFVLRLMPSRSIVRFACASKRTMKVVGQSSWLTNHISRPLWAYSEVGDVVGNIACTEMETLLVVLEKKLDSLICTKENEDMQFAMDFQWNFIDEDSLRFEFQLIFCLIMLQRKVAMMRVFETMVAAKASLLASWPNVTKNTWLHRQKSRRAVQGQPNTFDPRADMVGVLLLNAIEWSHKKGHLRLHRDATSAAGGIPSSILPAQAVSHIRDADAEETYFETWTGSEEGPVMYMIEGVDSTGEEEEDDEDESGEESEDAEDDDEEDWLENNFQNDISVCPGAELCLLSHLHYPQLQVENKGKSLFSEYNPTGDSYMTYMPDISTIDSSVLAVGQNIHDEPDMKKKKTMMCTEGKKQLKQALEMYISLSNNILQQKSITFDAFSGVESEINQKLRLMWLGGYADEAVEAYVLNLSKDTRQKANSLPSLINTIKRVNNTTTNSRFVTLHLFGGHTSTATETLAWHKDVGSVLDNHFIDMWTFRNKRHQSQFFYWRTQKRGTSGVNLQDEPSQWNLRGVVADNTTEQQDGTLGYEWATMWCHDGKQVAPISFHCETIWQLLDQIKNYIQPASNETGRNLTGIQAIVDVEVEVQTVKSCRWRVSDVEMNSLFQTEFHETEFVMLRSKNAMVRGVLLPSDDQYQNTCNLPIMLCQTQFDNGHGIRNFVDIQTSSGTRSVNWSQCAAGAVTAFVVTMAMRIQKTWRKSHARKTKSVCAQPSF